MDSSAASQLLYLKIASYSIVSRIRHLMVTVKGPYWIRSSQPDLISIYDAHIILQQTIILPHMVCSCCIWFSHPTRSLEKREKGKGKKNKKVLQIIDELMFIHLMKTFFINHDK